MFTSFQTHFKPSQQSCQCFFQRRDQQMHQTCYQILQWQFRYTWSDPMSTYSTIIVCTMWKVRSENCGNKWMSLYILVMSLKLCSDEFTICHSFYHIFLLCNYCKFSHIWNIPTINHLNCNFLHMIYNPAC